MAAFNEEYRFGSARWANTQDIRRAGLLGKNGRHIGYWNNCPMRAHGDASMITIGGAGSGKFRDQLAFTACNSPGQRMLMVDPRGEASAVSRFIHAIHGEYVYDWTPVPLAGRPSHSCNPFDILDPKLVSFVSDCKMMAECLVPIKSTKEPYFSQRAQEWVENFLKYWVDTFGEIRARDLVWIMNSIEADIEFWTELLQGMMKSRYHSVRRIAGEMLTKQTDSPKEFGSILGELYGAIGFLDDENLLQALDGTDFSLSCLTDKRRVCKVFLNIPAEYLGIWAPITRVLFTSAMLFKVRKPDSPRVLLVVDEAGQLKKFDALMRSVTFGRGAGIIAWTFWQDIGQIARNFDQHAVQTFLGSAQYRQLFGARDYETAKLFSDMCGYETLTYDDTLKQSEAKQLKRKIAQDVMLGNTDPLEAGHHMAQLDMASSHRTKQQRKLISADEIMNVLGEDEQLLFVSGLDLPPIRAQKHPYFSRAARKQMAGKYLDTPYHDPKGKVRVHHWYGARWHKVKRGTVPAVFRKFPQHHKGIWEYPDGFYSHS